jgi:hypothetical protein
MEYEGKQIDRLRAFYRAEHNVYLLKEKNQVPSMSSLNGDTKQSRLVY